MDAFEEVRDTTPERKESINKFLTEKLLGKCWHDWTPHTRPTSTTFTCSKCKTKKLVHCSEDAVAEEPKQDLFTPDGFFQLWEKAQKEEWWDNFCFNPIPLERFINPETFPILLAEFMGWEEEQ